MPPAQHGGTGDSIPDTGPAVVGQQNGRHSSEDVDLGHVGTAQKHERVHQRLRLSVVEKAVENDDQRLHPYILGNL